MKTVLVVWLIIVALELLLLSVCDVGSQTTPMSIAVNSVWLLIGLLSWILFMKEPNSSARAVFLNFSLFLIYVVGQLFYFLIGPGATFFTSEPYSTVQAFQYLQILNCFLLSFAIVYVVIDSLFASLRIFMKYVVSILIVGGVLVFYYSPFFSNSMYLYSTEDVADFRAISMVVDDLAAKGTRNPTAEEVAALTNLGMWKDGEKVGILFPHQKVKRVAELLPYLEGDNYVPLVYRPLFLDNIYMNVLCIMFIFLFFGYQYTNDPPQGAYLEKIVFLFLPFCSLEVLHHFAYIKSVEAVTLLDIIQIGQFLSLINLLMITFFFGLRLRFITSVKGEFYERELVSDAEHISRWRDAFDNLVVRHFLNPKAIHGRLFAPRSPGDKT